ncbi:MAG: hypothetical protein ACFFBD_17610 [Candidatus Hodarchaeota archaeon]
MNKIKLNQLYRTDKLGRLEKKEFWKLVSEAKIEYERVPVELAEKFGIIKARIMPWKLRSVKSGILLGITTFILGFIAWIWWFKHYIFNRIIPLDVVDFSYWIGFILWIVFIFLIMEGPHELSHLIVAQLFHIKFRGWGLYKLQPTWDIEYSSYLQASFNQRAIVHLIGTPVNLFQYLLHLTLTLFWNRNFWPLLIPFLIIYGNLIWMGIRQGYGDIPKFLKELKKKRLHRKKGK